MPYRLSVLAVASEERSSQTIVPMLEAIGANVRTAPDCLTAMGILKSDEVDAVILEQCAGQSNVIDTARVLKSLGPDRYLPVLLIAEAGISAERRQSLLEADIDDVLGPDFDEGTLHSRLHALLKIKTAYDQLRQVRKELANTIARENVLLKQLREDNRSLKVRSITDGLTALYNYRHLMEWLKTEFKISRRYGHRLSMMIADIDFFKRVNDEYGHPFGDYALKEVAVILKRCARESDLVARYAGDEFAIVCPRSGRKEIRTLSNRILAACRKHKFEYKGKRVHISLSLGTATYPDDAEVVSPELLVFLADQGLYQTKRQGRKGVTAWHEINPETRTAIRQELRGSGHPLLAEDRKSRLELAAAARLAGSGVEQTSLRPYREYPADE